MKAKRALAALLWACGCIAIVAALWAAYRGVELEGPEMQLEAEVKHEEAGALEHASGAIVPMERTVAGGSNIKEDAVVCVGGAGECIGGASVRVRTSGNQGVEAVTDENGWAPIAWQTKGDWSVEARGYQNWFGAFPEGLPSHVVVLAKAKGIHVQLVCKGITQASGGNGVTASMHNGVVALVPMSAWPFQRLAPNEWPGGWGYATPVGVVGEDGIWRAQMTVSVDCEVPCVLVWAMGRRVVCERRLYDAEREVTLAVDAGSLEQGLGSLGGGVVDGYEQVVAGVLRAESGQRWDVRVQDGRFRVDGLPWGRYELWIARGERPLREWRGSVWVIGGETSYIENITLEEPRVLRAVVADPDLDMRLSVWDATGSDLEASLRVEEWWRKGDGAHEWQVASGRVWGIVGNGSRGGVRPRHVGKEERQTIELSGDNRTAVKVVVEMPIWMPQGAVLVVKVGGGGTVYWMGRVEATRIARCWLPEGEYAVEVHFGGGRIMREQLVVEGQEKWLRLR